MHAKDIAQALEDLRDRLSQAGVPFAVIGALAMRQYGYIRYTEDIDILTTPEGLDRIHAELIGRGLVPRESGLRKKLRETRSRVHIDVIQSGEPAGAEGSPVSYPEPASSAFATAPDGIRYPTLAALMAFKIASGVWGKRLRDLADAQELIKAANLDEAFSSELPEAIRARFIELVEATRQERDIE
ncbi:MAG: hypothetical protein AB7T63_04100 [Planctomycetota bacterium]